MAGAREVACSTLNISHPYLAGMAESWIRSHATAFEENAHATFAITFQESAGLCGAIGLSIQAQASRAELGYWVGSEFWRRGICTEAARAVLDYGFRQLKLRRIYAGHFASNPASGRVLQKIGMQYEGTQREHEWKWEHAEDRLNYGILAHEWLGTRSIPT